MNSHTSSRQLELPDRLLALAERDPRRAVRLTQRWFQELTQPDAAAHCVLAWVYLRWERLPEANTHFMIAASLLETCDYPDPDYANRYRYREGMLIARQLGGEGVSLQLAWQEQIRRAEGDLRWADVVRYRNEQIAHLNLIGCHSEADTCAAQQLDLLPIYGSAIDHARYLHVRGVAAAGCGRLDQAETLLAEALQHYATLHRPMQHARVLFERAWTHQRREQFHSAHADLTAALRVFQRLDLPLRIALCTKDLGTVAANLGEYAHALAHTYQARSIFAVLSRQDMLARCDLNLGVVAHYSGLYELALLAYQGACNRYQARGDSRLALICQRNCAAVYLALQQPDLALGLVDQLADISTQVQDALEQTELLQVRARIMLRLGNQAESVLLFQQVHTQFLQLGNRAAAAEALIELGWLTYSQGQVSKALEAFTTANSELTDRPAHRWRALYGLGAVAQQSGDLPHALSLYRAASQLVSSLRQPLTSEHASSGIFAQAQYLYQAALLLAIELNDLPGVLAIAEQQRAVAIQQAVTGTIATVPTDLQARHEVLRQRVRQITDTTQPAALIDAVLHEYLELLIQVRHQQLPLTVAPQPFDLQALRDCLRQTYHGDDWSVLVPLFLPNQLALLTITSTTISLEHTDRDAAFEALLQRSATSAYRLDTYRDIAYLRGKTARPWQVLCQLADRLVPQALRQRLHPNHRLIIVPSGALHAIPWAALHLGDAWLCERAIVQFVPALSVLKLPSPASKQPSALLIGCTDFQGRAPALPLALASLDLVQACWPGMVQRLENEHASRMAIREAGQRGELREYRLLHIASHAAFATAHGLMGHIKLTSDDLLIEDIVSLQLHNALVVLAACSGAASEVLPGDEVVSMNHGLLRAGASGVMASLWPVYDHALLPLLDAFYTALTAGYDAAAALTYAQRTCITQHVFRREDSIPLEQDALFAEPIVWASFCILGTTAIIRPLAGGSLPANGASDTIIRRRHSHSLDHC